MIRIVKQSNGSMERGFTLLEVVIALSIVAVSVLAIASAMNAHTATAADLEQRVVAYWIANNQIATLRHDSKIDRIKTGNSSDRTEMAGHDWRTRTRIERTDVEGVFLVTVTVHSANSKSEAPHARLVTAISDTLDN